MQGSDLFVRLLQTLWILTLVAGCTNQSAQRDPPQPSIPNHPAKAIPPLLPITIGDVLQLPDIAIDEANGVGPGFRYWGLTTGNGFPYVYAEAYDEPFLT